MNEKQKKLKKLSKGKKSTWIKDAEFRIKNRKWLFYSSNIARRILAVLDDKKEINQAKLAATIKVSPQYISKVVKGKENLSLETIAKLSEALNVELITFPHYKYSKQEKQEFSTFFFRIDGYRVLGSDIMSLHNNLSIGTELPVLITNKQLQTIDDLLVNTIPSNVNTKLIAVVPQNFGSAQFNKQINHE